jgi:predicted nuclease with TOPRIM domain
MTYFDPAIYCKQNLKKEDLEALELTEKIAKETLESALDHAESDYEGMSEILDRIQVEIVKSFAEIFRLELGYVLQDYVVGIIDSYEGGVEEVEEPETFYYDDLEEELPFTEPDEDFDPING